MKKVLVLTMLLLLSGVSASAHEFHTSLMTVDHNRSEKTLEVTLRVFAHDLEPAIRAHLKRHVDIGASGSDQKVFAYIRERISFKTAKGKALEARWVGKEAEAQVIYYYFELPYSGDVSQLMVSNSLFFERFEEQVNYVTLRSETKKWDLVFKVGDKLKKVED